MTNFHSVSGIAAGMLAVACMLPYIASTLKGQTKPHRVTWWVLCTLEFLMAGNQFLAGGGPTVWLPLFAAIGHCTLAILSIRYGEGRWGKLDVFLMISALFSVVIWQQFNSPILALGWNLSVDFLGFLPTLRKARRAPETESLPSWVLSFLGTCLNLLAVEHWSGSTAILPLYLWAMNGLILLFLLAPNFRQMQSQSRLRRRIERNLPRPIAIPLLTLRQMYNRVWASIHSTPLYFWLYAVFVEERYDFNHFATRSSYRAYNKNRHYQSVPVAVAQRRQVNRHSRYHVARPEYNHLTEWS